jgi:hypothetical protein
MSSTSPIQLSLRAAAIGAAVFALAGATPASAQSQSELDPTHPATPDMLTVRPPVTSDLSATTPTLTPAERRETHTLAGAVFAKPAAKARAQEKVDAASQPDLSAVQPKPEWEAKSGLGAGGKGLEIKTPF